MKKLEVSAKTAKVPDRVVTINIDVPETVDEGRQVWGDDPILSNAIASGKITVQGGIRRGIEKGLSDEDIQKQFEGWKLGVAIERTAGDTTESLLKRAAAMSPDELAKLIANLKAQAKANA